MTWDPWEDVAGRDDVTLAFYPPNVGGAIQAMYFPQHRLIALSSGLPDRIGRSLLAEELAHHDLGHTPVDDPVETARMELRAQRCAAQALIDRDELTEACRYTDDLNEIAAELDVDEYLIRIRIEGLDNARREQVLRTHDTAEWYL